MVYLSRQVLERHIFACRILGIWPKNSDTGYWYRGYFMCIILLNFILIPISMWLSLTKIESIDDFCEAMIPSFYSTLVGIKAICIYFNRKKFMKLFDLFEQLERAAIHSKDENRIMENNLSIIKYIFVGFGVTAFAGVNGVMLYHLFNDDRILLWPAIYPFDWQQNAWRYYAVLALQYVSTMHYNIFAMANEAQGPSLFILLTTFLDILGKRLCSIGANDEHEMVVGMPIIVIPRKKNIEENQRSAERELIECAKLHQLCIEYV